MLILSLDSCGPSCGVCVWQDGRVVVRAEEKMERGQDARLMPMIVDAMREAGVDFSALDKIAVTRGPGSFTGVRVGLAAARGLGLASGKPVIGIDRFALYHALHARPGRHLLVVIHSKRVDLFCQFFPRDGEKAEPVLMNEQQIQEFLAAHPDTDVAGDGVTPEDDILTMTAQLAANADPTDQNFLPQPLYLRAPDVNLAGVNVAGINSR